MPAARPGPSGTAGGTRGRPRTSSPPRPGIRRPRRLRGDARRTIGREQDVDEDRQPDGPDPVYVEPPAVPAEGPQVHPGRIEERLHREALLDDAVRRAEEQDARPPGLPADRGLAHDEDAGAVQPDQEQDGDWVQ